MHTSPQAGIFALGTGSHAYLEFDVAANADPVATWSRWSPACASHGPRSAASTWSPASGRSCGRSLAPGRRARPGSPGFNEPVVGPDGYALPATQHDVVIWLTGASYDVVFDLSRGVAAALAGHAVLPTRSSAGRTTTTSTSRASSTAPRTRRSSRRPRSPSSATASRARADRSSCSSSGSTTCPHGKASGSIGRRRRSAAARPTATSSTPTRRRPTSPHRPGRVRQDLPAQHRLRLAGRARDDLRGLLRDQPILAAMLDSMVGRGGPRDELTRFTHPLTGAYYFVPSSAALAAIAGRTRPRPRTRRAPADPPVAASAARRHPAARPSGPAAGSPAGSSRSGSGPATGRCGTG